MALMTNFDPTDSSRTVSIGDSALGAPDDLDDRMERCRISAFPAAPEPEAHKIEQKTEEDALFQLRLETMQECRQFDEEIRRDPASMETSVRADRFFRDFFRIYPIFDYQKITHLPLRYLSGLPSICIPFLELGAPLGEASLNLQPYIETANALTRCREIVIQMEQEPDTEIDGAFKEFLSICSNLLPGMPHPDLFFRNPAAARIRVLPFCLRVYNGLQNGSDRREIDQTIASYLDIEERLARCVEMHLQIHRLVRVHPRLNPVQIDEIGPLLQDFFISFSGICPAFPIMTKIAWLSLYEQMQLADRLRLKMFTWRQDQLDDFLKKYFHPEPVLHVAHISQPEPEAAAPPGRRIYDYLCELREKDSSDFTRPPAASEERKERPV
jgi:hypothetical protein